MKLGVITSTWAFAYGLGLPDTFARVAAMGFRYLDVLGTLHGDPLALSEAESQQAINAIQQCVVQRKVCMLD